MSEVKEFLRNCEVCVFRDYSGVKVNVRHSPSKLWASGSGEGLTQAIVNRVAVKLKAKVEEAGWQQDNQDDQGRHPESKK